MLFPNPRTYFRLWLNCKGEEKQNKTKQESPKLTLCGNFMNQTENVFILHLGPEVYGQWQTFHHFAFIHYHYGFEIKQSRCDQRLSSLM